MSKTTQNKTSKIDKDNNLPTQTIEEKAESKSFFTKRNVIIIILTSLLSIGLLALTIKFILNIDWANFVISFKTGVTVHLGWLWLTVLILFVFVNFVYNSLPTYIRLRKLGIHASPAQWILFSLSISFFKAVTPSNFVYDPYTIFWMKTQGVTTSRATSTMFSNGLLWQAVELLVHIPSYIIVMTRLNDVLATDYGTSLTWIIMMNVGIFVDVFGVLFMLLLCFSRRAHYVMSSIFNRVKKAFKMKYHTKAEIEEKYKNRAVIRQDSINYFKDWKNTLLIVLIFAAFDLIVFFTINPALFLVNNDGKYTFNAVSVFNATNMAFNANRINILPGQFVGLESCLVTFLHGIGGINGGSFGAQEQFLKQGIFVFRLFLTFFTCLIGLVGFGVLTGLQVGSFRKDKGSFISNKYE